MARHLKVTFLAFAALAWLSASTMTASAIELNSPAANNALARQQNADYLRALRSQLQREQFQQQQRFNREQDRNAIARPQNLDVPKIKPTCQTRVFGSNILKSCR